MKRAAEAFARGVCSDLALRGMEVVPAELGTTRLGLTAKTAPATELAAPSAARDGGSSQRRSLAGKAAKWSRRNELALMALGLLCVAATIWVRDFSGDVWRWPLLGAWLFFSLLSVTDYRRRRLAGMRGLLMLLLACLLLLVWLLAALILIFGD